MTTLDPGASVVLTQGLLVSPRSTAFLASSAAPIMTCGFDVLVHEVIAAITTWPWSTSVSVPSSMVTRVGFEVRCLPPLPATAEWGFPDSPLPCANGLAGSDAGKLSSTDSSTLEPSSAASSGSLSPSGAYVGRASRKDCLASVIATRSCGRFGPAIDGTTVERSSSRYSENAGSLSASCQRPCSLA